MEKLNLRHVAAVLCLLLAPAAVQAQTYEEILARHPDVRMMSVVLSDVSAYAGPNTRSRTQATFRKGDLVVVYDREGIYYKVALPERGHVGFVRVNFLRSSSEPVPGGAARSVEPRRSVARQEVPPPAQPSAQEPPPQHAPPETAVIRPQPARPQPTRAPRRAPAEIDQAAGGFTIVVASATEQAQAVATLRRYASLGLPSSVLAEEVKGSTRYRVAVGQYGNGGEANRARQQLAGRLPKDAWVLRVPPPSSRAAVVERNPAPQPARPQPARPQPARPQPTQAPRRAPAEIDQAAGGFTIVVASATEQAQAVATLRRYASLGLPSSVLAEEVKGSTRYRVAVGQYGNGGEANRARQQLAGRLPKDAWVLRVPSFSEASLIPQTPSPAPSTSPEPTLAAAPAVEPAPVGGPEEATSPSAPAVQQAATPQRSASRVSTPQVPPPSRSVQPERPVSRRSFSQKSGTTATVLNVVLPGAGHLYAGEARRGLTLLGLSAGSLSLGLALSGRPETICTMDPQDSSALCVERVDMKPLYVGAGISALAWLSGILDAGASARRVNVRRQQAQASVEVGPQLFAYEEGTRVGLSLRIGL